MGTVARISGCLKAGRMREAVGSKNLKGLEGHAELEFYLQGLISLGDLHRELGMRDCFFGASKVEGGAFEAE